MSKQYDYDAIIIGAGIGGLTCGCYLAKAGLKTLIVEKNHKPGGYCMSFRKEGFNFDACTHTLVSCRKEGSIGRLIDDFGLREELNLIRNDPSDIIITPRFKVSIFNDHNQTIKEFQNHFPKEKEKIKQFFEFILSTPVILFSKLRSKTFAELLNSYFQDDYLKTIISIPTFGTTTLPPSRLSAIVGCLIYREFIFDGGYYLKGGIGKFIKILENQFSILGGKLLTSNSVARIKIENNRVRGITLQDNREMSSEYIVSACDLRETYFNLIGKGNLKNEVVKKIESLEPTLSAFIVYLGLNENLSTFPEIKSQLWFVYNNKSIEEVYADILKNKYEYLIVNSPSEKEKLISKQDKDSLSLSIPVPFHNESYWTEERRSRVADELIKIGEKLMPNLSKHIKVKITASPSSLNRITLNYKGSAYGWASTKEQFVDTDLSQKTTIENLYLASHWSNLSGGITSVTSAAHNAAKMIIAKKDK